MNNSLSAQIIEVQELARNLPTIRKTGVDALHRLMTKAQGYGGQSNKVAKFLLGLYYASRYPFEMDNFRALDHNIVEDCISVLRMDSMPQQNISLYFENGDELFSRLAKKFA